MRYGMVSPFTVRTRLIFFNDIRSVVVPCSGSDFGKVSISVPESDNIKQFLTTTKFVQKHSFSMFKAALSWSSRKLVLIFYF
jgi:hypothetical protein